MAASSAKSHHSRAASQNATCRGSQHRECSDIFLLATPENFVELLEEVFL